jgi:hypothetical protein
MGTVYHVKNWRATFENNKSKERDQCSFVCVPNKQHGMGLTYILSQQDGAAIYGIWQLLVGALSQQKKHRDGWATDDGHQTGRAWAPSDLALRWRRPEAEISRAFDVLLSDRVSWIEAVQDDAGTEVTPSARQVPAKCPPTALEGKGREGKELKGKEGKGTDPSGMADALGDALEAAGVQTGEPGERRGYSDGRAGRAIEFVIPPALSSPKFSEAWREFIAYLAAKGRPAAYPSQQAWISKAIEKGEAAAIAAMRTAIEKNAQSPIYEDEKYGKANGKRQPRTAAERGEFPEALQLPAPLKL